MIVLDFLGNALVLGVGLVFSLSLIGAFLLIIRDIVKDFLTSR